MTPRTTGPFQWIFVLVLSLALPAEVLGAGLAQPADESAPSARPSPRPAGATPARPAARPRPEGEPKARPRPEGDPKARPRPEDQPKAQPRPEDDKRTRAARPRPETPTRPAGKDTARPATAQPGPRPVATPVTRAVRRRARKRGYATVGIAPNFTYFESNLMFMGGAVLFEASRYMWLGPYVAVGGGWMANQPDRLDRTKVYKRVIFLFQMGVRVKPFGFPCVRAGGRVPKILEFYAGPVVSAYANRPATLVSVGLEVGLNLVLGGHWKLGIGGFGGWANVLTHAYSESLKSRYAAGGHLFFGYGF